MSGDETRDGRRRLLVALDAVDDATELLDAAAEMASRMHADLLGLFIEDPDLFGLGGNPLIRTVGTYTGTSRAIAGREMERALRRQVNAAREAFERAAASRRVTGSFEVRRGRLAAALAGIEEPTDLVIVRRIRRRGRGGTGAFSQRMMLSIRRPLIMIDVRAAPSSHVFAVYDGSPQTEAALAAAAGIADRRGTDGITVIPLATSAKEADALGARARAVLSGLGHRPRFAARVAPDIGAICATVAELGSGVLVLHADHDLLAEDGMARLLDEVECSVMVVR